MKEIKRKNKMIKEIREEEDKLRKEELQEQIDLFNGRYK